jgi:hypothetical protein
MVATAGPMTARRRCARDGTRYVDPGRGLASVQRGTSRICWAGRARRSALPPLPSALEPQLPSQQPVLPRAVTMVHKEHAVPPARQMPVGAATFQQGTADGTEHV